jgi:uncharacterized protein YrrD
MGAARRLGVNDRDRAASATSGVPIGACLGWAVSTADGRLGVVTGLVFDGDGAVEAIDVRGGLFHPRHELVEVEDVLSLVLERRLLVVR